MPKFEETGEVEKIDTCRAGQVYTGSGDKITHISRDPGQKAPPTDSRTAWNRQGYRVSDMGGVPIGTGSRGGTNRGTNPNEPPVEEGKRLKQGRGRG